MQKIDNSGISCVECGENIKKNEKMHKNMHDKKICDECFNMYYVNCASCGKVVAETESIYVDVEEGNVCRECEKNYVQCRSCGKYIGKVDLTIHGVCEECADELE